VSGGVAPYTYLWKFGDGSTSILADPSHVYTSKGTFHVTLNVTDESSNVSQSNATIVVLGPAPVLNVTVSADPAAGASPLLVQFSATPFGGSPPYTFTWNFDDGTRGTGISLEHWFNRSGVYSVDIEVNDSAGGSNQTVVLITAFPALNVSLMASPPSVAVGMNVSLTTHVTGGSGEGITYAWIANGVIVAGDGANLTYLASQAGQLEIQVRVTDSGGDNASAKVDVAVSSAGAGWPATAGGAPTSASLTTWIEVGAVVAAIGIGLGVTLSYRKSRSK
jgi:PKD repeat protein